MNIPPNEDASFEASLAEVSAEVSLARASPYFAVEESTYDLYNWASEVKYFDLIFTCVSRIYLTT